MEDDLKLRSDRTRQTKASQSRSDNREAAYPDVAAILTAIASADTSLIGQLDGMNTLTAAGLVGNQALTAVLSEDDSELSDVKRVSLIANGAVVPEFAENVPANLYTAESAFEPTAVPEFVFSGGQSVSFSQIMEI